MNKLLKLRQNSPISSPLIMLDKGSTDFVWPKEFHAIFRTPPGSPERSEACIDGWVVVVMGDGWVDGQANSKKMMYFQYFSKTIRYFFLVVSLPLRRLFKTFSEKNSKKIKKIKFVKKFRTTFFSAISSIF